MEAHPRLKADAVFGSQVEHSAVAFVQQVQTHRTVLAT